MSEPDGLAEALAVLVFAIQGVTCRWAKILSESGGYQSLFEDSNRRHALRWLEAHAGYDNQQLLEALEIIHELLGDNSEEQAVNRVRQAIGKSYDLYSTALDEVIGHA